MRSSDVTLLRKPIKNAYVRVNPAGEVVLSVPAEMEETEIDRILKKRSLWIEKQQHYFRKYRTQIKEYVSGESVEYLGRNYRLKVIVSEEEYVKLSGGYVELRVRDKSDFDRKERLVKQWYKERAEYYFRKSLNQYAAMLQKEVLGLKIRYMKTRWGSCNPKTATVNLNIELIKKSRICIDYVVLHELAHLIHVNHDRRFYNYLSLHMPDWRERKQRLESCGAYR